MTSSKLKLLRIDVDQRNCPLSDATRQLGSYIEITSAALQGDDSLLLLWVKGRNMREFLRMLRDSSAVKRHHVLYRDRDSAWIYMVKESSGILKTIHGSQGLLASSIIIRGGVKRFNVVLPASNMKLFKRQVSENLERRGMSVSIYTLSDDGMAGPVSTTGLHVPFSFVKVDILSKLTSMEKLLMKDALREGFFEWPRRSDLAKIAEKHAISKATLSYHIRMAEKKIFEVLESKYGLLED
ncbi:MAG: helix-turn-helix domain-containing protein [Desulfurococcales archaeon]|nr:helix-turn-helix domain-containing protein [Desulfurococcales archaeon]